MSSPSLYATYVPRMLDDLRKLLVDELPDELAAAQDALNNAGLALALPAPADVRTAHFEATRDRLPLIACHAMESRAEVIGSAGQDGVTTTVRIYVIVGEGDLATIDESGFSAGMHAYMGVIAGLVQRRLPQVACLTSAVFEAQQLAQRWEPATDTVAGTWIQAGRLDLAVYQTVTYEAPQ